MPLMQGNYGNSSQYFLVPAIYDNKCERSRHNKSVHEDLAKLHACADKNVMFAMAMYVIGAELENFYLPKMLSAFSTRLL